MKHDHDVDRLLGPLQAPDPPSELRARSVEAASKVLAETVKTDVWTRLWRNRPLRLVWATSVLALLAGHLLVTLDHRTVKAAAQTPPTQAAPTQDPDLRAIAALPRIDLDAAPIEGGRTAPPSHRSTNAVRHRDEENPT
jgi:hypothetical protein